MTQPWPPRNFRPPIRTRRHNVHIGRAAVRFLQELPDLEYRPMTVQPHKPAQTLACRIGLFIGKAVVFALVGALSALLLIAAAYATMTVLPN